MNTENVKAPTSEREKRVKSFIRQPNSSHYRGCRAEILTRWLWLRLFSDSCPPPPPSWLPLLPDWFHPTYLSSSCPPSLPLAVCHHVAVSNSCKVLRCRDDNAGTKNQSLLKGSSLFSWSAQIHLPFSETTRTALGNFAVIFLATYYWVGVVFWGVNHRELAHRSGYLGLV